MLLSLALLSAATAGAPHVILAADVGVPDLVQAHAEVFLSEQWSVEAGAGIGLLPLTVHGGARYTFLLPDEGWGDHRLRLAPGVLVFVFPNIPSEGMAVADVDASWVWWPGAVGVTAGARLGAGVAFGNVSSGLKLEPALEVVPVKVGIVF